MPVTSYAEGCAGAVFPSRAGKPEAGRSTPQGVTAKTRAGSTY